MRDSVNQIKAQWRASPINPTKQKEDTKDKGHSQWNSALKHQYRKKNLNKHDHSIQEI